MTILEHNAYASVPRIAGALVEISKHLELIAKIELANSIDCTSEIGRNRRSQILGDVRKDLGIPETN